MEYRELCLEEADKIKEIDATCFIKKAWRMNDSSGEYELTEFDWTDYELPNGILWHLDHFRETLRNGGKAFGCLDHNTLVGYATLDSRVFGIDERYVLLDQLFVSKDGRSKGIGRELVHLCMKQARLFGAEKIYLCAGSSEDTIAFYKKIGFEKASEINMELFMEDPNDIQLEMKV